MVVSCTEGCRGLVVIHHECEDTLKLCGGTKDGKGYFNQFGLCRCDRETSGLVVPRPDGPPLLISSDVTLFGPKPAPCWTQKFSCIVVALYANDCARWKSN